MIEYLSQCLSTFIETMIGGVLLAAAGVAVIVAVFAISHWVVSVQRQISELEERD